jgi:hypothetical protein
MKIFRPRLLPGTVLTVLHNYTAEGSEVGSTTAEHNIDPGQGVAPIKPRLFSVLIVNSI